MKINSVFIFFLLCLFTSSCFLWEGEPIVWAPQSVNIKAADNSKLNNKKDEQGKYYTPLKVGSTIKLEAVVYPKDADNTKVVWYTSNNKVATVEDGLVSALSLGDVTITVVTEMAAREKSIKIKVIE